MEASKRETIDKIKAAAEPALADIPHKWVDDPLYPGGWTGGRETLESMSGLTQAETALRVIRERVIKKEGATPPIVLYVLVVEHDVSKKAHAGECLPTRNFSGCMLKHEDVAELRYSLYWRYD